MPDGLRSGSYVLERCLGRATRTGRLVGGMPHVPDGCLVLPSGRHIAVELECSPKWGDRYGIVLHYYATGEFDAVRWFVEGATLRKPGPRILADELAN